MRAANDRPNVILINCDDLGYGDLGCYGSTVHRTPGLDGLAEEGMRLTSFYMPSSICSPSRAAMMTGCYAPRVGFTLFDGRGVLFPGSAQGLDPSEVTIARMLKDRGYATMHIGKWHCGDQVEFLPTRHGFDAYYGIPYSNDMGVQVRNNWPPLPLMEDEQLLQAQPDQANLIERYTERSIEFMRAHRDEPFFLYLGHMQVHLPLYAPKQFVDASLNGRFGACVEAVDWSTQSLMYELRRLGLDENTLVIFTSDNGGRALEGGSNAPLRGRKAQSWEGGYRVPCIVRWKGQVPAGVESGEIVSAIDFLPTLAAVCGAEAPTDRTIDGLDASDLLLGRTDRSPRETFLYYLTDRLEAVRHGKWKLVAFAEGQKRSELYDLESDVGETTDLYDKHPDIAAELEKLLQAGREDLGDAVTQTAARNARAVGKADNPKPLTTREADYPYIMAEYDLPEHG